MDSSLLDDAVRGMASTLATQPLSLGPGPSPQPGDVVGHIQPTGTVPGTVPGSIPGSVAGSVPGSAPPSVPGTVSPDSPNKRRPGRPKGSGKKAIDLNTEPKIKRPVGRPRKDGLPAGSVGPKKPGRPRKRAPGSFATATTIQSPGLTYPVRACEVSLIAATDQYLYSLHS